MTRHLTIASLALALFPHMAEAHATLETTEAPQNSTYKAVIRIGHGCAGSPTTALRVVIPEGVIAVKPMPKPGWNLQTETGPYTASYDDHGKPVNQGVKTIEWSGGRLDDDRYDEFVFQARLTKALPAGHKLYIPVTQICEQGQQAWTQIPAQGQEAQGKEAHALNSPAPAILIKPMLPQSAAADSHAGHTDHGAATHPAPAATAPTGLSLTPAWSRATPPGSRVAGGYLTIENKGSTPDRLISGSSEISNVLEIHEMSLKQGVMKMHALDKGLVLPPGAKVELKPGGYHIMFIDLKRPLRNGESFKGELVFERAGKVPVTFSIMPVGATSAGAHQTTPHH